MVPVAIGGLHDDIVGLPQIGGVPDDGLVHVAQVAGEDQLFGHAVFGAPQLDLRRAQQVARVVKAHPDPFAQVDHLSVFTGVHLLEDGLGVVQGVERLHRGQTGALALLVFPLGIPLLDVGGVPQHDGHELSGEAGGQNAAIKALLGQQGQTARVVDVGVGHQHIVDVAGGKVQGVVVVLVPALLKAAVDQDLSAVDLQTVTAAGDRVGRAEECKFHSGPSRTWIRICGAS